MGVKFSKFSSWGVMFSKFSSWGVMFSKFCGGGVMFSKFSKKAMFSVFCSLNKEMGDVAPTVSLHCFLFSAMCHLFFLNQCVLH